MTSPLAAKATFNRHTACEMGKKQKQFSTQMSSLFCSILPCPAPTPFVFRVTVSMQHSLFPHHSQPPVPSGTQQLGLWAWRGSDGSHTSWLVRKHRIMTHRIIKIEKTISPSPTPTNRVLHCHICLSLENILEW